MKPFSQLSFRRILLIGLFIITVPVLFGGIGLTYRKARTAFLETARQNLTEGAIKKGENIQDSIQELRNHLVTASESSILKNSQSSQYQIFLNQLQNNLPTYINCVQLVNLKTNQLSATTCDQHDLVELSNQWPLKQQQILIQPQDVYIQQILPRINESASPVNQLELILASPVYDLSGNLTYALIVKASLLKQEKPDPGILIGYPVVINQEGIVLAHPIAREVGRHIDELGDGPRLKKVVESAIAGQENSLHLFALEKNGLEVVAGYSAIPNPVTSEEGQMWIILAVSPLDDALLPLKDIWIVLLGTGVLMMTLSIWGILFIAHILAHPLEELRNYAIKTQHLQSREKIPENFYIREIKQLSEALNHMVDQLKTWAEKTEQYWEEAKIASQLKSEFLATTSHELRTPLNSIINYIQFVRDGLYKNEDQKQQWLQKSEDSARYLLTIINSLLDISQIESGKVSIKLESFDLTKIVEITIELQKINIEKQGLNLCLNLYKDPLIVYGDPVKFKQVLINIIGNATKFTEAGTISISSKIEVDYSGSSNDSVVITVQDTGIGIAPQLQNKLFRPFEMIDSSNTRKYGGTGLGLAISRNYMELMGGSINLYSAGISQGTMVQIRLPLLSQKQEEITIESFKN